MKYFKKVQSLYLENSVDIVVFFIRAPRVPENALIRISDYDRKSLFLYLTPCDLVDAPTSALVNWDGFGRSSILFWQWHFPCHDTHQVDAHIYRYNVSCTVSSANIFEYTFFALTYSDCLLDKSSSKNALSSTSKYTSCCIEIVHPTWKHVLCYWHNDDVYW